MRPNQVRSIGALTILVLALGLIATTAHAADCQTLTIENDYITSRSGNVETVHTAVVGAYLWVNTGDLEETADLGVGSESHQIPDFDASASVCDDGSVSFTALPLVEDEASTGVAPPSTPVEADPMTVETVIDVEPVFVFDLEAWFAYMAEALA